MKDGTPGETRLEWGEMRPAILLAHARTGGTFLAHCLSTHPDILCPRHEPLAVEHSPYFRHFKYATPERAMLCVWDQPGYHVNMVRITGRQFRKGIPVHAQERGAMFIHLTRENLVACAVSQLLNNAYMREDNSGLETFAVHSYRAVPAAHYTLDPVVVVHNMRQIKGEYERKAGQIASCGGRILALTYELMVGLEGQEAVMLDPDLADIICDFLQVRHYHPLHANGLRKVNAHPYREVIENWEEIVYHIRQFPEFAAMVDPDIYPVMEI